MEKENRKIRPDEIWESLGISNDFIFGKVMQDPELCLELLRRILPELEIERIEYPEAQKAIKPDIDAKSVRLDVYVRDGKGTVYDIEIQAANTRELPKRTRYYQSMVDMQMIDRGEHYKQLKPCYIIFICLFDMFEQGRHRYTFENMCKEDKRIRLEDGATKIFLNASGDMDDISEELKVFLEYVGGKEAKDTYIKELDKAVEEVKKNREWRREYMTLLMRDAENLEEGMRRGLEKGMKQGLEKGMKQGLEKGMKQGLEKGKIYGTISVYREMGMTEQEIIEKIQKKFNLTPEEAASSLLMI